MDPRTRVATANVRVPVDEFLAVWDRAARQDDALRAAGDGTDWYPAAVAQTCRWMAAVPLRTALCGGLPRSPVTQRACVARADLVEQEWQAAQDGDRFAPAVAARPGWCDGVRATFRWAWCGDGPPPAATGPGGPGAHR